MSRHTLKFFSSSHRSLNAQNVLVCNCNEKYCNYISSDDEGTVQSFEILKMNRMQSTTTIGSSMIFDILQTQCHCRNCPLKNMCKFEMTFNLTNLSLRQWANAVWYFLFHKKFCLYRIKMQIGCFSSTYYNKLFEIYIEIHWLCHIVWGL